MVAHLIIELRDFIDRELTTDLPDGVHPVSKWCADPLFFPGATGLIVANSWDEVVPGSQGVTSPPPPAPVGGVLVLGNYQATLNS